MKDSTMFPSGIGLGAGLIGVVASCLSGCGGSTESVGKSDEVLSMKVAYIPIAECAQLYVAEEKGLFQAEGLEVDFVAAKGGQNSIDRVQSGEVQVAFSSFATLLANRSGASPNNDTLVSVFGATYETASTQNHGMFIRKAVCDGKAPIECLANPKLRFGINEQQRMEHAMLNQFMLSVDSSLSAKDRNVLPYPFSKLYDVLKDGTVDVACLVEPQITQARKDSANLFFVANHYLAVSNSRPIPVATYVARQSICEAPEALARFRRAMTKATDYMSAHSLECAQIIAKYTMIPTEITSSMGYPQFRAYATVEDLNWIARYMADSEFLPQHISVARAISSSCSE